MCRLRVLDENLKLVPLTFNLMPEVAVPRVEAVEKFNGIRVSSTEAMSPDVSLSCRCKSMCATRSSKRPSWMVSSFLD